MKQMYRFEAWANTAFLFEGAGTFQDTQVFLDVYNVIKETPKGVWIDRPYDKKKFINLSHRKKWACPTIEQAKESFVKRKEAHIRILLEQLKTAQEGLVAINTWKPKDESVKLLTVKRDLE